MGSWIGIFSVMGANAEEGAATPMSAPDASTAAVPASPDAPAPTPETKPAAPAAAAVPAGAYVEDFLNYRLEIQLKIESVWADYLGKYGRQLKRGRAVFTYHVNPDGKITLVETKGVPKDQAISVLAHRSIVEANKKTEPFPASVKAKHPSGYFNQVAFAVK